MTSPRLFRLVSSLPHARRCLHQAVARAQPAQRPSASGNSSDYIYAIYEDLMLDQSDAGTDIRASNEAVDGLLEDLARRGNTRDFETVISRTLSAPPTEHQRDMHVKAHIINASLTPSPSTSQRFPTRALALLHQYEASGHFAPIKSYTRVISALFNVRTCPSSIPSLGRAAAHAQAWDLFSHMRYVAHPVPDAHLYALMIRACGSFSRPEPERALDLWMEMHENDMRPTKGTYEAIIRVCGRAGPEWVGEGLKLAREMSDQHSLSITRRRGLWCALLEGCKRTGDLQKARWILAEAVRANDGLGGKDSMVDAELMTHIFHTYASYKVPFRRETTRLVEPGELSDRQASTKEDRAEETPRNSDPPSAEETQASNVLVDDVENIPSFSRLPPQTSSDVIAETRLLFERILYDHMPTGTFSQSTLLSGKFACVQLTPPLVNAYLSVFYRHASIETSHKVFNSLFNKINSSFTKVLHPDEYACINALERCATTQAEERHIAAQWAGDVWRWWELIEANGLKSGKAGVGSYARLIERAHIAMRRVLVLSGDVDGALALLRTFVSRYPPNAVIQPAEPRIPLGGSPVVEPPPKSMAIEPFSKPYMLSTRTILTNPASSTSLTSRPLVRLTSVVAPKDDRVPPIIAFNDVELLHTRLAEHERVKDLGYIKWVCMAYSNALKKRRAAVLRAAPVRDETGVD